MEAMRKEAMQGQKAGPCTMVVGPTDAGKSTLCKVLTNYAVRTGWEPLFVDLDVGQGMITVPGNIAAVHLTAPIDVEKPFASSCRRAMVCTSCQPSRGDSAPPAASAVYQPSELPSTATTS